MKGSTTFSRMMGHFEQEQDLGLDDSKKRAEVVGMENKEWDDDKKVDALMQDEVRNYTFFEEGFLVN